MRPTDPFHLPQGQVTGSLVSGNRPPTASMATGCASDQEPLQGPALVLPADHRQLARPPPRWPPAAPATRNRCRGLPWYSLLITDNWPARRLDGHRLRRRPGTAAGPCPGIHLTDHQLLASTTCSMATGYAGDQERLQRPCPGTPRRSPAAGPPTCSMATGCAGDQERLQGPCPGIPRPITGSWPAPPERWPPAAPATRNRCRGPALVLPDRSPAAGQHHRSDGHRLRRRPGTAAGALPWYSPTDHRQLASTTGAMATGCAGDQEQLQRPRPGSPRPITGSWPAPPARWPLAAPATRSSCRGPALVLPDRSPAAGQHHRIDGHRLRR